MFFQNRVVAGRRLAEALRHYADAHPIVLGLPRGGVPVAFEVAHALGAPLDVLVVRKIGAPGRPELAIGAVGVDVTIVDQEAVALLGVPDSYIARAAAQERALVHRTARLFQREGSPLDLTGRTAIIVDDGVATGSTALAAIEVARQLGAGRVTIATPVCAPQARTLLQNAADDVVCLEAPADFPAVGYYYEDFEQTTDAEVRELLRESRLEREAHFHPTPS